MNLRAQGPRGIGTAKGAIYLADESEPVSRRVCEGEAPTPPPPREPALFLTLEGCFKEVTGGEEPRRHAAKEN